MDVSLITDLKYEDGDTSKEMLNDFIITYESLPELWDTSNAGYLNKRKRLEALNILRSIYKRIKPNATITDVRRKINTLRSNYRKEKRKILESSECDPGEAYKPTSWVYYALRFLDKTGFNSSEKEDDGVEYIDAAIHSVESPTTTIEMESKKPDVLTPTSSSFSLSSRPGQKRKREHTRNEKIKKIPDYIFHMSPDAEGISPEAIIWSKKLLDLDPEQRLHAEKAINDVLYEAQLGNLNRYSVTIN